MRMRIWTAVLTVLVLGGAMAAQDAPPAGGGQNGGGWRGGGQGFSGVGGQIVSIEGQTITLQTRDGATAKVKVSDATRMMNDGNPATLADFKVGDRIFAGGEQGKDGVWNAAMLGKRAGGGMGRGGAGGGPMMRPEDNGKTFVFGEITKIDGTKISLKKPDGAEQTIEVDDSTSFLNDHRESITLADFKVGQMVRGPGEVKNGVFVPKMLSTGMPRRQRGVEGAGAPPAPAQPAPEQKN